MRPINGACLPTFVKLLFGDSEQSVEGYRITIRHFTHSDCYVTQVTYNHRVSVSNAQSAAEAVAYLTSQQNFDLVVVSMASVWSGSRKWREILTICGQRHLLVGAVDRTSPPQAEEPVVSRESAEQFGLQKPLPKLTRRQQQALRLIVVGKTNREIARELNVAEGTVKLHSMSIYRSLGVSNRVQAVLRGQKMIVNNDA